MRSLGSSLLELHVIFELAALLIMIQREQNQSIGEILYQVNNRSKSQKQYMKIELAQYSVLSLISLLTTLSAIYGWLPQLIFIKHYCLLRWQSFEFQTMNATLKYYTFIKVVLTGIDIVLAILVFPILFYKIRKYHRYEYNQNGCAFFLYFLSIIVYKGSYFFIDAIFMDMLEPHVHSTHMVMSHSNIAFNILGLPHFFLPLVIILFKKNSDIFMTFSKIDNLNQASMFQQKIHDTKTSSLMISAEHLDMNELIKNNTTLLASTDIKISIQRHYDDESIRLSLFDCDKKFSADSVSLNKMVDSAMEQSFKRSIN